jgi:hypothetical protein
MLNFLAAMPTSGGTAGTTDGFQIIMPALFVVMVIAIVAACILVNCIYCNEMAKVAEQKGYKKSRYFWFCFFIPLLGFMIVLGLKDISAAPQNKYR